MWRRTVKAEQKDVGWRSWNEIEQEEKDNKLPVYDNLVTTMISFVHVCVLHGILHVNILPVTVNCSLNCVTGY